MKPRTIAGRIAACLPFVILMTTAFGATTTYAQPQVIVRYNPNTTRTYDVSFSRRFNPNAFNEGWGSYDDISLVQAAVQNIRNWDASMPSYSDWRIAAILIETNQTSNPTPTDSGFQDYLNQIKNVYARAKAARDWATNGTAQLTDQTFAQVNQLIQQYNSLRQQGISTYGAALNSLPTLAPMLGPYGSQSAAQGVFNYYKRYYPSLYLYRIFAG
jgi:hypothetical protein